VPDILFQVDEYLMRMSYKTVMESNMVDRSSSISAVALQLSMLRLMSLYTLKSAVDVE